MVRKSVKPISPEIAEAVAARFRALGEVSRLRIIQALHQGDKNVSDLVSHTGLKQPNVSRHLAALVNVGLVGRRKAGLKVFYFIEDESLSQICEAVCNSIKPRLK